MQPGPGEAALTLELSVVVFGIGVLVFLIIVGKLVWEWRRARRDESDQ